MLLCLKALHNVQPSTLSSGVQLRRSWISWCFVPNGQNIGPTYIHACKLENDWSGAYGLCAEASHELLHTRQNYNITPRFAILA